jgi:hypothetical protein
MRRSGNVQLGRHGHALVAGAQRRRPRKIEAHSNIVYCTSIHSVFNVEIRQKSKSANVHVKQTTKFSMLVFPRFFVSQR